MDGNGNILFKLLNMLRGLVRETCFEVFKEYRESLKQSILEQRMTREQVAAMIGKDAKTVGRYESEGLPNYRVGRTPMYLKEDVESFLETRGKCKTPENNC